MKLHVFNDAHGFFLNLAVNRVLQHDLSRDHIFFNLSQKTIYPNKQVIYLAKNLRSYKLAVKDLPAIQSIAFYPFDFIAASFLKELKQVQPDVKVDWVFWGYEYYQRPEIYLSNFGPYSLRHYQRNRSWLAMFRERIVKTTKRLLAIPVYQQSVLEKGYRSIDRFFSFLPADYDNIFGSGRRGQCHCEGYPISFLSLESMTKGIQWNAEGLTHTIMVGHAAAPSINHVEILQQLAYLKIKQPLLIPMEYGQPQYRQQIRKMAISLFNEQVEFLEKRLDMASYYRKLSKVGAAIFNFRWQEALGNIMFLVWNGSKIFLREESTVSIQFRKWQIKFFSIEKDLNAVELSTHLSIADRLHNKVTVENLLSEQTIGEYWDQLTLEVDQQSPPQEL